MRMSKRLQEVAHCVSEHGGAVTASCETRDGRTWEFLVEAENGQLKFYDPDLTAYGETPCWWGRIMLDNYVPELDTAPAGLDNPGQLETVSVNLFGNAAIYQKISLDIPGNPTLEDIAPARLRRSYVHLSKDERKIMKSLRQPKQPKLIVRKARRGVGSY